MTTPRFFLDHQLNHLLNRLGDALADFDDHLTHEEEQE